MRTPMQLLVSRILKNLDETEDFIDDHQQYGCPGTDLRTLIREFVPEAAAEAVLAAEADEIDQWVTVRRSAVRHGSDLRLLIPDDCLRPLFVTTEEGDTLLTGFMTYGSAAWLSHSRRCRLAGRRHVRTPTAAAALASGSEGRLIILSGWSSDAAVTLGYIARPEAGADDSIDIPRSLIDATIRNAAERILAIRTAGSCPL